VRPRSRTRARRKAPRKKRVARRHRTEPRGILVRQIIRKRPRARKSAEVLGLRCRVTSIMIQDELLVMADDVEGRVIAIPVVSPGRDGRHLRALGLREGQDVWLSVRA
jgi:hypothetical protein